MVDSVATNPARPLKIGLTIAGGEGGMAGETPGWSDLLQLAQTTEAAGFDSIWVPDHMIFKPATGSTTNIGIWECFTVLSALAVATQRVELGTLVACTGFRNPALLAKMADTIDEISGGRFILGLGAGWNELEYEMFGYPFDHRVSRFEEALIIVHGLLKTGTVDYEGRYFSARNCELRPRGPRPGGPPIMIGSSGDRMLALAARYADSWNTWASKTHNDVAGVAPLRQIVDAACAAADRDPATLERTAAVLIELEGSVPYPPGYPGWNPGDGQPLRGTPAELAEVFRAYAREGISHLQIWVTPLTPAGIERLAEVLPLLDAG
jgi:probable F420-dependent oxidoreductase